MERVEQKPTLEELQQKVVKIDTALSRLSVVPGQLGNVDQPSYMDKPQAGFITFNRANFGSLEPSERLRRTFIVVKAPEKIAQISIPALEARRNVYTAQITEIRLETSFHEVRIYLKYIQNSQFATEEDKSSAQRDFDTLKEELRAKFAEEQPRAPTPPVETPEKPKEPKISEEKPKLLVSPIGYKYNRIFLQIEGGEPVTLTEGEEIVVEYLYNHRGQAVNSSVLKEILEDAEYASSVGVMIGRIEDKLRQKGFFLRVGTPRRGAKWALGINPSEVQTPIPKQETPPVEPEKPTEEEDKKAQEPEKDEEKLRRYREGHQIFDITIDGREIKVQGRLTAVSLETLADTSSENKMRLAELSMALYGKDGQQNMSNARGLMGVNNKRSFVNLGLRAVIEGKRDQTTIYLERIPKEGEQPSETTSGATAPTEISEVNIEKLQKELEDLYKFRAEIQEQVAQGVWSQSDLDELIAEITQKEAQIRLRQPSEPDTLVDLEGSDQEDTVGEISAQPKPGGEEIETIPYHPEKLRTQEEIRILQFIVGELTEYSRLWFHRWQDALITEDRVKSLPYGKRQIRRYDRWDVKEKFKSAYQNMAKESLIPLMRRGWTEEDEKLWQQAEKLLQRLGESEEQSFFREVNKLIDRAAKEHYDMYPDEHEGDPIII